MILNDNLYTTDRIDRDAATCSITLNPEHPIYKAHFPEKPITPGVCVIQIAKELFENLSGSSLTLAEVVNAKFLSVINPLETKSLDYEFSKIMQTDDDGVKLTAIAKDSDTVYAKLSLKFKKS